MFWRQRRREEREIIWELATGLSMMVNAARDGNFHSGGMGPEEPVIASAVVALTRAMSYLDTPHQSAPENNNE
jgi:hypothetical protein